MKKEYVCPVCGKEYKAKRTLSYHMNKKHPDHLEEIGKEKVMPGEEDNKNINKPEMPIPSICMPKIEAERGTVLQHVKPELESEIPYDQSEHSEIPNTKTNKKTNEKTNEITEEIKFIRFIPDHITVNALVHSDGEIEQRRVIAVGSYRDVPTLLGLDSAGRLLPPTFFQNYVGLYGRLDKKRKKRKKEIRQETKKPKRRGIASIFKKNREEELKKVDFGDLLR
jgi:hypothetical protein